MYHEPSVIIHVVIKDPISTPEWCEAAGVHK